MQISRHNQQHQARVKRNGFTRALALLCVLAALCINSAPGFADGGASNRKEAINQALSVSDSDARVLGVKRITQQNGDTIFAVKIISNGRVKVIRIPKTRSN